LPVQVLGAQTLAHQRLDAQIAEVVGQRSADEKLHRQVIDLLGIPPIVGLLCLEPALREQIADRAGGGLILFARAGILGGDDVIEDQVLLVPGPIIAGKVDRVTAIMPGHFAQ
jgi:hypothetical protein